MRVQFFALKDDLIDLLVCLEGKCSIKYAELSQESCDQIIEYGSASQIPQLSCAGVLATGRRVLLIAESQDDFVIRRVPQEDGTIRFFLDQLDNQDTISLDSGGAYDEQTIVCGSVDSCSDSPKSAELMKIIRSIIRKSWVSIQSAYVSPRAEAVLDSGGRLTWGLRPDYDLKR